MTCCKGTSKDDVKNDEEDIVVKMKELIMKKNMKYKETTRRTFKNKPAAQAAGADPFRCNSINRLNPPLQ